MTSLRTVCLLALLVASASATPNKHKLRDWVTGIAGSLKPSHWLSAGNLQTAPSVEDVTWQQLENMSVEEGEDLIEKLYHLAQINHNIAPSFEPSPSSIPVNIFKSNGQAVSTNLNQLVQAAKQQPNFGDQEVTIIITGLPQTNSAAAKANKKLVQAYMQRYNGQQQPIKNNDNDYDYGNNQGNANQGPSSSEEDYAESWKNAKNNAKNNKGSLIVVNLGATITSFKRYAMLDVEKTGQMIGKVLAELTEEADVPPEIIHVVALGIGAQVAGCAGRAYARQTGQKIRRITALDPAKMFAKNPSQLSGLARGDAEFVDAIHTSTCGLGTRQRIGDVDFYPHGPASVPPGAKNVIEAAMRSARYFAESVRPGNERNFPAVAANSLQQYKNNNGNGKRAYMGIATDFDLTGDFILEANAQSPFGQKTAAQKQIHRGNRQSSQSRNSNNNNNNNDY